MARREPWSSDLNFENDELPTALIPPFLLLNWCTASTIFCFSISIPLYFVVVYECIWGTFWRFDWPVFEGMSIIIRPTSVQSEQTDGFPHELWTAPVFSDRLLMHFYVMIIFIYVYYFRRKEFRISGKFEYRLIFCFNVSKGVLNLRFAKMSLNGYLFIHTYVMPMYVGKPINTSGGIIRLKCRKWAPIFD